MKNIIIPAALLAILSAAGCQKSTKSGDTDSATAQLDSTAMSDTTAVNYKLPDPKAFEGTINGKKTGLYTLKGSNIQVAVTNYGARIVSLLVPDKTGKLVDVAMGFGSLKEYEAPGAEFFGPVVGRFGNRIGKAQFTLDGKTYKTAQNNNGNTLHGGPDGFHRQVWDAKQVDDKTLQLTYLSKDGEGGFPGNVTTTVTYSIDGDSGLKIDYKATTDKPTPYNPTSHGFFNLNGDGSGTVNNHVLMIDADKYSKVDKGLIPQGEPASVEGTPFDFRKPTAVGARVDQKDEQLTFGGGYDHNWVLNHKMGSLDKVVEITGDKSGIKMSVLTTEPAMQFYGGNFFTGADKGKYGLVTKFRGGFALEAQHYPDSPNKPTYPNTILKPGQTYTQTTSYRFEK
ncbi:aldose epimerase family protein [Fibrella sp. ES10-3-2-2]|nr:galactose mutarotase [Fibrella sp. ES10-3-2-2]